MPWDDDRAVYIQFDCSEFSSFCPVTGQPDYGSFRIAYIPSGRMIETKSLKLFLWSYRNRRSFNENLVNEIFEKINEQVQPEQLCVMGKFHARGGISVTASVGNYSLFHS